MIDNKSNIVLHLTHTDLRNDWRIRKEMNAAASFATTQSAYVYGLGIKDYSFTVPSHMEKFLFKNFNPFKSNFFYKGGIKLFFDLLFFSFFVIQEIRKNKVIIVHAHDTAILPLAVFIKFISGAKLIYDAHELESKKNGQSKIFAFITTIFESVSWKHIDGFITVSKSIEEWYFKKYSKKTSRIILNSPNLELSCDSGSTIREKLNISENDFLFIHIGLLVPGRGIETLLEVFKKNERAKIVFMGFGELEDEIISVSKNHSNIFFHKHLENKYLLNYIKSADYGICTVENISLSDYFALPNKFFEYICSGLPVICSDFPDMKKYVEEFNLGFTCQPTYIGVSSAVAKAISNKPNEINHKISKQLSWSSQQKKLVELYNLIHEE